MVNFLAKLFIKNYKDVKNEKVRTSYGVLASVVGILSNIVLVAIKLTIGIITFSISIIADATNNIADIGSSVLSLVGFKLSSRPADKDHPYGHQRFEYIVGLIIAMVIAFVGIELLTSSIDKIINPGEINSSYITYILLGIAVVIKILQGLFYLGTSKKINSISLKASSKDSINDSISTFVVLIGIVLSKIINFNLDGYFGVLVSLFILYSAINLIREAMSPLIGEKPDPEIIKSIVKEVENFDGIYGTHDLIAHLYGPSKIFISMHCEVDRKVDVMISHDLIDVIEYTIKTKYGVEIVIHMDPIVIGDPIHDEVKKLVNDIIREFDPLLMFHDFRMVEGVTHTNLIFDVVVPFKYHLSDDEVKNEIAKRIYEKDNKLISVINIDKDYIGV